ncbi:MarR family transcriptional regulator [Mucilaginibacter rubeus]|uniref:MarR family transcriptional regulator n=1 Tax=Mucilaginibacter rubeus TaxID=2027860 RepID=A0AAE6MLI7_9SPHI|nr:MULTISPECIES: MarR family transcriptional regulator [Mucilaginibacter]QEM07835.1 MarR family transcriptional regulator [Mucilaginibacter rubeus]QEM20287.1 MarR family transcriptional regulator [Mucilaginibacter gossypii]QTE42995.1 MarR family transcriptional regulator [Mucilaginibacter rubeus]QTE49596.1 MarR family transcriptional regulator [Mucilaginibacter rubeus]QTE54691.1 MarR family transcriptional regulator [Mucilaginibacter rubeus]
MQLLFSKSLRRLSRLYIRAIARELPELTSECFIEVLQLFSTRSKPFTQKEIADILQVDKSRVATLVDELKVQGYIFTEKDPLDRRAHFVFLTEKGLELVPVIKDAIEKVNVRLCNGLDTEKINAFHLTMVKMERNLNQSLI